MAAPRLTHEALEKIVLANLETGFPNFAGHSLTWAKVSSGQDPPDFIGRGSSEAIGLELVEWLDGEQMTPAKSREFQHYNAHRVLALDWENQYQPRHFSAAFPPPRADERIVSSDEASLRHEFLAFAAEVDRAWMNDRERWGSSDYRVDFPGYPLFGRGR